MRVLITGVGGFVGGHAARACLAKGWEVVGVRRKGGDGTLPAGLRIIETDLTEPRGLPEGYDALIHCAAEIPARCPDPDALYQSNVGATRNLLRHAADAGACQVIYMSSMSVYGPISAPSVSETSPLAASDAYGRSKIDSEELVREWAAQDGRSAVSIRLPGVVGRGSHDNFLSGALRSVLSGETVVARNPASLFNNVVYIEELAAFLVELASTAPQEYAALTLAADGPMRMDAVLALMATCSGRPLRVEWRQGGAPGFLIQFEQARRMGYRPATVESSVARFVSACIGGGEP